MTFLKFLLVVLLVMLVAHALTWILRHFGLASLWVRRRLRTRSRFGYFIAVPFSCIERRIQLPWPAQAQICGICKLVVARARLPEVVASQRLGPNR